MATGPPQILVADRCAMENDFGVDLQDIFGLIDGAEVIVVRFQLVEQRLLIDARRNALEGPMLILVPRANSSAERFQSLKRLRPGFPMPDRIMSFQWPRQVGSLQASGVWGRICQRLGASESEEMAKRCAEVFHDLERLERQETMAAIRGGEGYETVWEQRA